MDLGCCCGFLLSHARSCFISVYRHTTPGAVYVNQFACYQHNEDRVIMPSNKTMVTTHVLCRVRWLWHVVCGSCCLT